MWQKYSKVELKPSNRSIFFPTNLQALLQNPDVLKEIDNPHFSTDGVMRDIMDGEFYSTHPIFSTNKKALQLLGYYDDLELANPLGSKSKIHKIGKFSM